MNTCYRSHATCQLEGFKRVEINLSVRDRNTRLFGIYTPKMSASEESLEKIIEEKNRIIAEMSKNQKELETRIAELKLKASKKLLREEVEQHEGNGDDEEYYFIDVTLHRSDNFVYDEDWKDRSGSNTWYVGDDPMTVLFEYEDSGYCDFYHGHVVVQVGDRVVSSFSYNWIPKKGGLYNPQPEFEEDYEEEVKTCDAFLGYEGSIYNNLDPYHLIGKQNVVCREKNSVDVQGSFHIIDNDRIRVTMGGNELKKFLYPSDNKET